MAWKRTTTASAPSTPINATPASGAGSVSLTPVLSANYVDADDDAQVEAQWQVDDDSDFTSPVWTRTVSSAETSTTVTSSTGTFANERTGKAELSHGTTYYWRVRYSDGLFSDWSLGTGFTTNTVATPTNISPESGSTVNSLTPVLSASSFSDPQIGHTASMAQWQISSSTDFSEPLYDSGEEAYSASHAVPTATISDRSSYRWRVRFKDSSNEWSAYSTPTTFSVAQSFVSVFPAFTGSEVGQGDLIKIDVQVKNGAQVENDADSVHIDIFNADGEKIVDGASMTYLESSSGVYRYSYTVPQESGGYVYTVTATVGSESGYAAGNFTVGATASGLSNIEGKITAMQSDIDILLGAFVAVSSSVDDAEPSATSFVTTLTNAVSDFYKNSVITFTSGPLNGQTRRIASYDGVAKRITVSPALSFAPVHADTFSIVKQNVYVEEQAEALQSDVATIKSDVAYIKSKVDAIYTLLESVDDNLGAVQTALNLVRSSQQKFYQAHISDVSEIALGDTYTVRLSILDYESTPSNPGTTPTVTLYDATGTVVAEDVDMTQVGTAVYEYTYDTSESPVSGLWEAVVTTSLGDVPGQMLTDYFYVVGSPAQVIINSVSDITVPSISAQVTIQNEGSADYEYQYEWCVVAEHDNQCGGGDDVYYGSAAKLIQTSDSFNTSLSAAVADPGTYWFKLFVHYGTETSASSRSFEATVESPTTTVATTTGGRGGIASASIIPPQVITLDSLYQEMQSIRAGMTASSEQLARALETLGIKETGGRSLLEINQAQGADFKKLQNKMEELSALSASLRQVIEQGSATPIVETFMTFNSVEVNFLIVNPASVEQTVKFKALLPEEVRPEHIVLASGLHVGYDASAKAYAVSGDIPLGPKESTTRKVEVKDIWTYPDSYFESIQKQTETLFRAIDGTQYSAQGTLLKSDIEQTLTQMRSWQREGYSSPQEHIVVFRESQALADRVAGNITKMQDLVSQEGAYTGLFGRIGGIQTFGMWGMVLAIVFGFGMMSLIVLRMWRSQALLVSEILAHHQEVSVDSASVALHGHIVQATMPKEETAQIVSEPAMEHTHSKQYVGWALGALCCLAVSFLVVRFGPQILFGKHIEYENTVAAPVSAHASTPLTPSPTQVLEKSPEQIQVTNTPTGWLRVRRAPDPVAEEVGRVYPGEVYTVRAQKGAWYAITMHDGSVGWISATYVIHPTE